MREKKNRPYPSRERGLEACITITEQGIKFYGNKAAFRTLVKWMSWIADSEESEHFSFSLLWNLTSKFASKRNVFVLVDEKMKNVFGRGHAGKEIVEHFEFTFMAVENNDLKALRRFEESGLLPADWGRPPS